MQRHTATFFDALYKKQTNIIKRKLGPKSLKCLYSREAIKTYEKVQKSTCQGFISEFIVVAEIGSGTGPLPTDRFLYTPVQTVKTIHNRRQNKMQGKGHFFVF